MPEPTDLITEFVAAWSGGDADTLAGYFSEDAVYHNIPMEPVRGRAAIRDFIAGFLGMFDGVDFTVHHQIGDGGLVMNERTDTFHKDGKDVALPVTGVFEVVDGRIVAWRDYFDMATVTKALGG